MSRLMLAMVGCLVVGAGGMWVASNFKVKFEPVGAPDHPPPPVATAPAPIAEPARLPAHLLNPPTHRRANAAVVRAAAFDDDPTAAAAGAALPTAELTAAKELLQNTPIEVSELLDGSLTEALFVPGKDLAAAVPLRSRNVTLNFQVADASGKVAAAMTRAGYTTFKIVASGEGLPTPVEVSVPGLNAASTTATLNLGGAAFNNRRRVGITAVWVNTDATMPLLEARFRLPTALETSRLEVLIPTGTAPAIVKLFSGRYAAESPKAEPYQLFPGFARVQVKSKAVAARYDFLLYSDAAEKREAIAVANEVSRTQLAGDVTEFLLTWDQPAGTPGLLLVRERAAGDVAHHSAAVKVTVNARPDFPAITLTENKLEPVVGGTARAKIDPATSGTFLLGTNVVNLAVGIDPALAEPLKAHAKLLLFVNRLPADFPKADAQQAASGLTDAATFRNVTFPGDGEHVAYVVIEAGGVVSPNPLRVNVSVRRGGFEVTRVTPTDLSNAPDYRIRVSFAPGFPVNPATLKKANFTLKLDGTGNDLLAAGDPPYDPATNTVALQVGTLPVPAGQYLLSVLGTDDPPADASTRKGLRDVFGNPLGGTFGGAGQAQTFAVIQPVGGAQPSQSAGVAPTGQNAVFPEYTPFREFKDGANPGDRVESRVVRLYYTRDAHRVTQILNRDARSYNGPAVDIRRRAADRVRDEADTLQNERQSQERAAVLSAVATRQAESQLKQLEAKLQTARTEQATTTVQLSQRQQQLDQAVRAFTRDQTNIGVRAGTDTSVDASARRVAAATADIERSRQALRALQLNDASSLLDVENTLTQPRADLATSQTSYTNAIGTAQFEIGQKRADLTAADFALQTAQKAFDAAKTDDEKAQAKTRLDAAVTAKKNAEVEVLRAEMTQNTAVAPKLQDFQAKQTAFQVASRRADAARQALAALPAQNAALAEAQRDLDRANVVARGRAATDTGADLSQDGLNGLREEIRKLQLAQASAASAEQAARAQVEELRGRIQGLRAEELRLTEAALGKEGEERRKREEQFRRELAAALADPDTYVAGKPESPDPVLQCSVSVIGEGLIHIRGPIKGLNVIRTMINQIDAPTGQVRVGVHTVQVNGERVDKMNRVVENIQRYIDHSRFLTATSAQMLRNAVTTVASRKAVEAGQTLAPGCTQADRDQKYLYAFFGKDFIDELKTLDSEFLRTGNKVLSLHSMDSTSLASALFLMALARNDVREEILREFQCQLQTKLPQAEWQQFVSGLAGPSRLEACFDRQFCTLAKNARFPSFLGFFTSEVLGADTLTPVQREFIRLAQIFKARMVTEMELKQRVMERTLLEDRVGNFRVEQRKAKEQEDEAKADRLKYQLKLQEAIVKATEAFGALKGELDTFSKDISVLRVVLDDITTAPAAPTRTTDPRAAATAAAAQSIRLTLQTSSVVPVSLLSQAWERYQFDIRNAKETLLRFNFAKSPLENVYTSLLKDFETILSWKDGGTELSIDLVKLREKLVVISSSLQQEATIARAAVADILRELRQERPNLESALVKYNDFFNDIDKKLYRNRNEKVFALFAERIGPAFIQLQTAFTAAQSSARAAALSRRALDEKKLLDMLVDDMEEKLIELLDGTRAHTANVDNYLKALATALDDDFNTQFYQPAFKKIRTLGTDWAVQLGQIESTTVLTNNRVLGKVSPTASMEFDLPRREILIKEAFKGAKAAVQDYGALLNDPVFLSMVKMFAGSPVGATYGGFGGLPAVKNALPGLPGSSDELIMAQAGGGRPEFGTYLEGLIADPAIYKFETGTGYEIRPVLSPDGQAVVFAFDYMYTTDVREPVRADEKHLGRVKRHLLHTDVQLSNYELREVSKYWVSLKAARTSKGVSLLQDIPVAGALFRPAPSASSSLQQNLIYSQAAIFPTLFDLMGLRYAPAVADLTPDRLIDDEFVTRGRQEYLRQYIFDYGASRVDDALRILYGERRPDLYRSQRSIPSEHPNGYRGAGLRQRDAYLQEEYDPRDAYPPTKFAPGLRLPQNVDRDPFAPSGPTPAAPPIPPGSYVPGHTGPALPGGLSSSREVRATPLGTTVTRAPAPPRAPAAPLPPLPTDPPGPRVPSAIPTLGPPPPPTATPAPGTGVITRSQAPVDPPAAARGHASDPVPLPRGSYFPR